MTKSQYAKHLHFGEIGMDLKIFQKNCSNPQKWRQRIASGEFAVLAVVGQ